MGKFQENFEAHPFEPKVVEQKLDEIALRAVEMREFQIIIENAPNKLEAIKSVREELPTHFPEIKEIPAPQAGSRQVPIGFVASNEFRIAKKIVELLWKKSV